MNVTFFPDNKLSASIEPIYNGHTAIVSHNTDRLIDDLYALAEIGLFKHNIQATSFLNAFGDTINGENVNYGETIKAVNNTGRIGFGLYFRGDMWVNPNTEVTETIPDYYGTEWTELGATAFSGAVIGEAKASRSPNHGQQMYDISGGAYGYDMVNGVMGASNLSETQEHIDGQLDYLESISGLKLTSGSYANGAQGGWNVLTPTMYGMRNSVHRVDGNGNIKWSDLTRTDMMMEASTTRTWDAVNAGEFATQELSLAYTKTEVQRAIAAGGWFSDFMHWHSLYRAVPNDVAFFDTFYEALDEAIGSSDVWRAGNEEVNEYYFLANSINKIGSYVSNSKLFVFLRFNDVFSGTDTNGISNAIDPTRMSQPISIRVDLTGTSLAGKDISSSQATTVRKLGGDKWIINVSPVSTYKNGYMTFVAEQAINSNQLYTATRPVLSVSGDTVTSNQLCKFVVWRKASGSDDTTFEAVKRTEQFSKTINYTFDASYEYKVGAINRSRHSSLITK